MRPNWENECVNKSALIEWLRPYLHTGEPIPADVLISDIQMMPPTLTPQNEPERAGLYGKYTVRKNTDGSLVTDCFVLRPDRDPAAVAALRAYADATDNAELAADITNWVGAEPNEPLTLDELLKMDGEPVYVVFMPDSSGKRSQSWALVNVDKKYGEVYLVDSIPGASCYYDEIWANLEAIYRRPPEGEGNA